MIEVIGIVASFLVLLSFIFSKQKNIRLTNIAGAVTFIVYGILIGSFSVVFMNSILVLVHIYHLRHTRSVSDD